MRKGVTKAGVFILVRKWYLFPLFSEMIFFPTLAICCFWTTILPIFALIISYFAFILHFYVPFSLFLSPFFLVLSPFSLFSFPFPPLSLPLFLFFPPNDIDWYPPGREGEGVLQYIDHCTKVNRDDMLFMYTYSPMYLYTGVIFVPLCRRFFPLEEEAQECFLRKKAIITVEMSHKYSGKELFFFSPKGAI